MVIVPLADMGQGGYVAVRRQTQASARPARDGGDLDVAGRTREADAIIIPPLPAPLERDRWVMRVEQAVMCASGREDQGAVQNWLMRCRNPSGSADFVFGMDECPPPFRSLDVKLGAALQTAIDAHKDLGLRQRVERLQLQRFQAGQPLWGGRRLLFGLFGTSLAGASF